MEEENKYIASIVIVTALFIISLMIFFTFANPMINVWSEGKAGEAELARAESNRQIAMLEAKAKMESAKSLAEAEIIRAQGVAKANEIIGQSLKQNEAYLRYLWIQGLQTNNMSVVYIPTEANLPIMEAARWTEERNIKDN